MSKLIVCSLSTLNDHIAEHQPSHLISLLGPDDMIETPTGLSPALHLQMGFNDIGEPMDGLKEPKREHVEQLISFADAWDKHAPLLIHCWAGVSRSTASAYIIWCHLTGNPKGIAGKAAARLRQLSPTATPNPLLIAHADDMMGAGGAMISAIAGIGRGATTYEGTPFEWEVNTK